MTIEIDKSEYDNLIYKLRQTLEENRHLNEKIKNLEDEKSSLSARIEKELEPRIKSEERAYDYYVTMNRGLAAEESFSGLIDKLYDMASDYPQYFDWEDKDGDLCARILYEINEDIKRNEV